MRLRDVINATTDKQMQVKIDDSLPLIIGGLDVYEAMDFEDIFTGKLLNAEITDITSKNGLIAVQVDTEAGNDTDSE